MLGTALRSGIVAVLALGLLPGLAAGARVDRDAETGIVTIVDDLDAVDEITITQTSGQHVISRVGGGLTNASLVCTGGDPDPVSCPLATSIAVDLGVGSDRFTATSVTAPISVAGGIGDDRVTTGGGRDVLAGGPGNDTLTGGAGVDDYFGETGDDTIEARDGAAERISCGADNDQAGNDFIDIIAECERGLDGDGDGFSTAVDCNDAAASIFPGARELYGNGVDEDCDGRDDANPDADGDGFAPPLDCDDGNRNVRPNTPEIRGNRVDENCDRRKLPWAQFASVVSNRWAVKGSATRLRTLIVRNAPRGTRITLRCRGGGCPFRRVRRRTVPRDLAPVRMDQGFRRARLRPGARLQLTLSRSQTITRTYSYTVQRSALPASRTVCRAPRARRGRSC